MQKYLSKNSEDTLIFAENFAKKLKTPNIIVLSGDLGAGKTTFSKGLAKGLGIKEHITSPTFTLLNEYKGKKTSLFHFDMYRLSSVDEAYALGFESYFDNKNLPGIIIVEWAENVPGLIKTPYIQIQILKISDNERQIIIEELL